MDFSGSSLVLLVVALLTAISVHEAMHAFTAHWLGDDTAEKEGRITLNPLAHIDIFTTVLLPIVLILLHLPPILAAKPVPFNPNRVRFEEFGAALVGISGPLSNLVMAFISAGLLNLLQPDFGSLSREFLLLFMQLNVGLFVFNMLPLPPLDGSRLVYAFAPRSLQQVMEQIESMGLILLLPLLFILLPFISPIMNTVNDFILRLIV
jgi:Zn-dependent protease